MLHSNRVRAYSALNMNATMSIRVRKESRERIKSLASATSMKESDLVRQAIDQGLPRLEQIFGQLLPARPNPPAKAEVAP